MSQPFMCDDCGRIDKAMPLKVQWGRWAGAVIETWDFCSRSCLISFVSAHVIYPAFPQDAVQSDAAMEEARA